MLRLFSLGRGSFAGNHVPEADVQLSAAPLSRIHGYSLLVRFGEQVVHL